MHFGKLFQNELTLDPNKLSPIQLDIRYSTDLLSKKCSHWIQVIDSNDFCHIMDRNRQMMNEEVAEHIKAMWMFLQKSTGNRSNWWISSGIDDNAVYLLDNIARIVDAEYIPSYTDILRVSDKNKALRGLTVEITDYDLNLERIHWNFNVIDVGKQYSTERKWMSLLSRQAIGAVIFVASLSSYDQFVDGDGIENGLLDVMDRFEVICNSEWFRNARIVLILNKKDIFLQKVKSVPFEDYFPKYKLYNAQEDESSEDHVLEFIRKEFVARHLKSDEDKPNLSTHVMSAVDDGNVNRIFEGILYRCREYSQSFEFHLLS